MNESRGVHDRQYTDFKREVTHRLDASVVELKEMNIDRRQLKAMVKNQNYHFTELQKEIGVLKNRLNVVEKTCEEVPNLIKYTEETDSYLQNYLPNEVYGEIHRCMQATLESAPTKMRLDHIEYATKRMFEGLAKIRQIGSLTQETFIKNEFNPLKLDYDSYSIRTQYEDEERERVLREQQEAAALLNRKTSGQLFNEKIFSKQTMKKLTKALEHSLNPYIKNLCKQTL